jgi:hypothetical protein
MAITPVDEQARELAATQVPNVGPMGTTRKIICFSGKTNEQSHRP